MNVSDLADIDPSPEAVAALEGIAADPELPDGPPPDLDDAETPLAFFLAIMRDPCQPFAFRFEAAKQAAPYMHAKPNAKAAKTKANPEDEKPQGDMGAFEAILGRRGPGRPRLAA